MRLVTALHHVPHAVVSGPQGSRLYAGGHAWVQVPQSNHLFPVVAADGGNSEGLAGLARHKREAGRWQKDGVGAFSWTDLVGRRERQARVGLKLHGWSLPCLTRLWK